MDPVHFTDYNRTLPQLEATALFSVLVAGKAAIPTARALDRLLINAKEYINTKAHRPFKILELCNRITISNLLLQSGIGCHTAKGRAVYELVHSGLDLRTCSVEDLEGIYGIGPKTSRFFVLHTRPNQQLAVLDVHLLRFLRDWGHTVPAVTPSSTRRYKEIERTVLWHANEARMSPAEFDLMVWNRYRELRPGSRSLVSFGSDRKTNGT